MMEDLILNTIDITELISQLQQEKLLVNAERSWLQDLHEKLNSDTELLLKIAWINLQQRVNLDNLVALRFDCTPEQCCRRANLLTNSVFLEAKDALDYQVMVNYGDFLSNLRQRPDLLAQWLVIGESLTQDQKLFSSVLHSIVAGLYGSLVLQQDVAVMLNLLQNLAKLQLVTTDNPRRLLKQSSCAFSKMYFLFHENLITAKHFLIAALQTPILKLLAASSTYLDINPHKAVLRMSHSERVDKFGEEGSEQYEIKINQYRKWMIKRLYELAKLFILSLEDNIYCFPSSLAWLIRQIAGMISKSFSPHSKEINAISTDLVFNLFICPAIIQPEPYGICDAPVSDVARHNLMQIAQILQMLALLKFETPEAKLVDLYDLFQTDCVSNILDVILMNCDTVCDSIPVENVPGIYRNISLFTEQELLNLVAFMRRSYDSIVQDQNSQDTACSDYCSNNADNATTLPNDPIVLILKRLPTEHDHSPRSTLNNNAIATSPVKKMHMLNKAKSHLIKVTSHNGECEENATTVLIIPLHLEEHEHIGLLPEDKVLTINARVEESLLIDINDDEAADQPELVASGQEKRTRFSQNDEGSIGNTSDNLEVISEAASNHSVASSIELENEDQNDNLSDMVSANVSGRGTPNISGRDTPSSQVTENEDNRPMAEVRPAFLQQPQPLISKQIRSEIDDKFCKFEIKKLLEGDETISIISDTWSTDVLASDSETIDANDRHEQAQPVIEAVLPLLDVSETQSESAWSTDVFASDTERLTEFDNDDVASVAPSDDTASVARSDDAASVAPSERSEIDDQNLNDRRMSATGSSNHYINYHANPTSSTPSSSSAFQEYRRIDITVRRESMPNYVSSSSSARGAEAQPEVSSSSSSYERSIQYSTTTVETNILRPISRNCMDPTKREAIIIDKSIDIKRSILGDISNNMDGVGAGVAAAGPSGISTTSNKSSEPSYILVKNAAEQQGKFEPDMQLSNTSLNSSSSGSSNSSEHQNKNGLLLHGAGGVGGVGDGSWRNKQWSHAANVLDGAIKKANKPSPSTGAIPKSISFDMSAEKGDKDNLYDEQKGKRSQNFFSKLRMNFRPRRGKLYRGSDDYNNGVRFDNCEDDIRQRRHSDGKTIADTSEDILAKYRNKTTTENGTVVNHHHPSLKMEKSPELDESQLIVKLDANSIFNHAKRKLRLVLSSAKTQAFRARNKDGKKHIKKDLESLLLIELAKARGLKQWRNAARIAEALRCVRMLDIAGFNKICDSLRDDYCNRTVYLKYLMRSKQTLLASQDYLNELIEQVKREKELCASVLIGVCVRAFLERHNQELGQFCDEFRKLTLVDEKNDHLAGFLDGLYSKMRKDVLWHDSSDEQFELAQLAIERSVMIEVYTHALYPNGESDRLRDSLLNDHLKKLSSTITPNNKYLMINKIYQNESPWLPAQEALQTMAAYKTPREKLQCVRKCTIAIDDLLSLAQGASAAADDVMPVLIYVIIQANPQDLLSTIQYVNSFYNLNTGEDNYLWTQFCSAVEFTKTMEYAD